jgi:hypothetical protein
VLYFGVRGRAFLHDSETTHEYSSSFKDQVISNGFLTVSEMTHLASKADGWNSSFNRRQIPKIRKIVEKGFKEYHEQI